ncbi:NAD(P)-dependent oxidoreductase [Amycolatopsis sp. YIM 10]|uniref:NAD-dependent epimerase/dehydratase family protein n=1 Tax=Amycolatopsis sp. YIM 10 TaxID=2653857 RepID=UPI0012904A90|nr:NAD-dependent epimerase/dehydratase [Amycolatopsis sp. YIM 10]QFU89741.1 dTDP-L-rhamnose 4-epimerase [Amycolatopsis sp. YIM 10]
MRYESTDTARPLVTVLGASGFVGTAVVREFAAHPVRLRLVSRRPAAVPANAVAEAEVCTADLTRPGAIAAAVRGSDVVIQLVAYINGPSTWRVEEGDKAAERVNLGLVRELVAVLREQGRTTGPPPVVVFAGSLSQAGVPRSALLSDETPDEPVTVYDRQKLEAERELVAATEAGVLRGITLRLPTVYGAGVGPSTLERGVVAAMMRRALAGEPLTMWHDGTVARDLVCVDDVARAFAAAVDHADALAGRRWLIGSGEATRIGDLFHRIAAVVAARTGRPPVPVVSTASTQAGASDLFDVVCGSTAFGDLTGWSPRTDLATALEAAVRRFELERAG